MNFKYVTTYHACQNQTTTTLYFKRCDSGEITTKKWSLLSNEYDVTDNRNGMVTF